MEADKCLCNCKRKDVCNEAICGRPENLSIYVPVIYDEIGVNVCRQFTLPEAVLADYKEAECITADVVNISITQVGENPVTTIADTMRPNCSKVTLTNIAITAKVKLFDLCGKYLGSTIITGNYMPGSAESPDYNYFDEKTNPQNVVLDIFTPMGVGMTTENVNYINVVGMYQGSNFVTNGVNLNGTCKAMNYDSTTGTFSLGLSLILRTVYYEGYEIPYIDKTHPIKADTSGRSENTCLKFVESGLLSKEIKPLELNPPKCEGRLKDEQRKCYNVKDCKYQVENRCQVPPVEVTNDIEQKIDI